MAREKRRLRLFRRGHRPGHDDVGQDGEKRPAHAGMKAFGRIAVGGDQDLARAHAAIRSPADMMLAVPGPPGDGRTGHHHGTLRAGEAQHAEGQFERVEADRVLADEAAMRLWPAKMARPHFIRIQQLGRVVELFAQDVRIGC